MATVVLALVIVALLVDRAVTRAADERQVSRLLQRVQAPERAIDAQARREGDKPRRRQVRPPSLDDDGAMIDVIEADHGDS